MAQSSTTRNRSPVRFFSSISLSAASRYMHATLLSPDQLRMIRRMAHVAVGPRLLVDADDKSLLLERCETGRHRQMADRLKMKCDAYLDASQEHHLDLDAYSSNELFSRPGQFKLGRIMSELAFAGWLWDQPQWTQQAKAIVLRRAREAMQTSPGASPEHSHHRSPLGIGSTGGALAWTADLIRDAMTADEWQAIVQHCREYYFDYARSDFYRRARLFSVGFNKTLSGMCAVGQLAMLVADDIEPELLNELISESLRSAMGYAREGMDDDGGCYEGPGYGSHCIGRICTFGEALRRHGLPIISDYKPLHRHGRFMAAITLPAVGETFSTGDSHGDANISPYLLLIARWANDPVTLWAYDKGLGREDQPAGPFGDHFNLWWSMLPQQIAWRGAGDEADSPATLGVSPDYAAADTGDVAIRSDWSDDAVAVAMLSQGRRCSAEAHLGMDAGVVDLCAFGRELLHDPGYGFHTADAHSTVRVASIPQESLVANSKFGGRLQRFHSGDFAAFATAEYAQLADCRWADRTIMLVRGEHPYVIVADNLNYRSDWTEFLWRWVAPPAATIELPAADRPATIIHDNAALEVHSFTPAANAYPKPFETSWSIAQHRPGSWSNSDAAMQQLHWSVAGYTGVALTILAPRRIDNNNKSSHNNRPRVKSVSCAAPGVAVSVQWGDVEDVVVYQPYSRQLQTDTLEAFGELAIVRQINGVPTNAALVNGYHVNWNGKPIIHPRDRASDVVL